MTTMNGLYGDNSDHNACEVCGFCIHCDDCSTFGCGSPPSRKLVEVQLNHRKSEDGI